jgi:hypothetical protein
MPNIIGENISAYVQNQINIRQRVHGSGVATDLSLETRTPEQLTYLNSRTAWVKLASGIRIGGKYVSDGGIQANTQEKTAKKYVLFSGISSLKDGKLNPRGTSTTKNNIYDPDEGVYNVNPFGTESGEVGLPPMPGIVDAEIKCENRGSVKKATVNIKCYSPEQFKILDTLYLRIGYTMFLEWGWSNYVNNDGNLIINYPTLIEDDEGFFNNKWKKDTFLKFLPQIERYRKAHCGNYDGLLCKVTNFSWTFNNNGSYDIQLNLISLGDVVESLACNVTPPKNLSELIDAGYQIFNETTPTEPETPSSSAAKVVPGPVSNFISAYLFLQKLYLIDPNVNPNYWNADDCPSKFAGLIYLPVSTQFIKVPEKGYNLSVGNGFQAGYETFTYSNETERKDLVKKLEDEGYKIEEQGALGGAGAVLGIGGDLLNAAATGLNVVVSGVSGLVGGNSDVGGQILARKGIKITDDYTKQASTDFIYFSYNTLVSDESLLNDDGFYIRFGHLLEFIKDKIIIRVKNSDVPIVTLDNVVKTNLMYTFPYQVSLDPRVCIVRNDKEPINEKTYHTTLPVWKDATNGVAYTMNIYLNCNMVTRILEEKQDEKGNVAVFDVLQSICTELNKALGGVNNLEPVLDEDTNRLKIIDASYVPVIKKPSYVLELYGYDGPYSNFVRNFSIKTEIPEGFGTMASIGSTSTGYVKGTENTMFSKWNTGLIDTFKEEYVPANSKKSSVDDIEDTPSSYVIEFWNKRFSPFGVTAPQDIEYDSSTDDSCALDGSLIDRNITVVTEFYKYCQAKLQQLYPGYASSHNGFIPVGLSLDLEGLSGVKIYNSLNVDSKFLPANYPNSLKFIVKGVNHKISNGDWETNISTMAVSQEPTKTIGGTDSLSYTELRNAVFSIIKSTKKVTAENPTLPPQIITPTQETYGGTGNSYSGDVPDSLVAGAGSNLEKQTRKSCIKLFGTDGAKKQAAACGAFTMNFATYLASYLTGKTIKYVGGNHAWTTTIKTNADNLGIYKPESSQALGVRVSKEQVISTINDINSKADYGDLVFYHAHEPPRNAADDYKFHAQFYTGAIYNNPREASYKGTHLSKWSSSNAGNYSSAFVYGSSNKNYTWSVWWYRVKDEYKK